MLQLMWACHGTIRYPVCESAPINRKCPTFFIAGAILKEGSAGMVSASTSFGMTSTKILRPLPA